MGTKKPLLQRAWRRIRKRLGRSKTTDVPASRGPAVTDEVAVPEILDRSLRLEKSMAAPIQISDPVFDPTRAELFCESPVSFSTASVESFGMRERPMSAPPGSLTLALHDPGASALAQRRAKRAQAQSSDAIPVTGAAPFQLKSPAAGLIAQRRKGHTGSLDFSDDTIFGFPEMGVVYCKDA